MAAQDRTATTIWQGDLRSGKGEVSFDSSGAAGPLPVSAPSRFEGAAGQTSPEELIAAAHAACFSMSLAGGLKRGGNPPERLETTATVTIDQIEGGFGITRSALRVRGTVPGVTEEQFLEAARTAEQNCPVSKALQGNLEITLDASLNQ